MAASHETLFFITPIGAPGTPQRRRSDLIHQELLAPVCADLGITVQRADWINEPTALLTRILQWVLEADYAVCDFSGGNPNVYYEAGVRHCTGRPSIHLAQPGEALPFDLKDQLTLFVDDASAETVALHRTRLREVLLAARAHAAVLNPVTIAAKLAGASFVLKHARSAPASRGGTSLLERDWSGLWLTNFGRVLVKQRGSALSGLYEHHSEGWEGRFTGLVGAEALWLSFGLRDSGYPGLARIDPRRTESFGLWVHTPQWATLDALKMAWEHDQRQVRKVSRLWKLYGRLDDNGDLQTLETGLAPQGDYLEFALREGTDPKGRTFQDLVALSDEQMERDGDFLFWLFPDGGPEGSFPGLHIEDFSVLRRSDEYRARLRKALLMMLRFYGFQLKDTADGPRVEKAPNFDVRKLEWIPVGHHHYGRITRVLRYCHSYGMRAEARAWYATLAVLQRTQYRGFMRWAVGTWRLAVGLEPETQTTSWWQSLLRRP